MPVSQRRGAVAERRIARYENPFVGFSKITRVEEVDLDNDGVAEALVEGIGTVRGLPPDIPVVGFVSRTKLPFENPIFAVFQKGKGSDWSLLLVGHLPLRCSQTDEPARCDQLSAFRSVLFRFDDRPQVALQIVHAGEPRLFETHFYRLDRGRLDTTLSITAPRSGVDVEFGPDGVTRRIAVDTFINKDLPARYRSFTLVTTYAFGERKFRILAETVEPEWSERAEEDLAYWGLVRQATFASDLARLAERQKKADAWALDPVELVKKRFPDARDVRLVDQAGGRRGGGFRARGLSRPRRGVPAAAPRRGREEHLGFRRDPVGRGAGVRVPGRGPDGGAVAGDGGSALPGARVAVTRELRPAGPRRAPRRGRPR